MARLKVSQQRCNRRILKCYSKQKVFSRCIHEICINGRLISAEIDTVAAVSILQIQTVLRAANGEKLQSRGIVRIQMSLKDSDRCRISCSR